MTKQAFQMRENTNDSASLVIRELKINVTMKYILFLLKKLNSDINCWQGSRVIKKYIQL